MKNKPTEIRSILIANRGEIAVRIIRAARDLGIKTIAVYSEADEGTLHVRLADERIALGGSNAKDTYLNIDKIMLAAIQTGADAVHPGYGFLSENAAFAKKVEDEGLVFIGPTSRVIEMMGDKINAREAAIKAKVPVLEGLKYEGDIKKAKTFAKKIGYPVIIKASAGGSGRGIRVCETEHTLPQMIEEASSEGEAAFGSSEVFIEKFLTTPKHIEVQIAADIYGNVIHIFERECTLQRRRQKLLEEAPSSSITPALRKKITAASVRLAKKVGYQSVGTMEFLFDREEKQFYFLEMNTRIQVEHPVTEEISGIDLLALQIKIAQGASIKDLQPGEIDGHALEFRIYSEDVSKNFAPVTGKVNRICFPSGPGVRVDTWIEEGGSISPYYDAMLAKIIVKGETRIQAIERARRALYESHIEGIATNIGFFRWLLDEPSFIDNAYHIKWLEESYKGQEKESYFTLFK
jgi:acetyl-CoA carboxylase biotin carboxylase subunit